MTKTPREILEWMLDNIKWQEDHYASNVISKNEYEQNINLIKSQALDELAGLEASEFICFLIDNYEGDIISEELLQLALADFLKTKGE